MNQYPKISIITPTFNQGNFIQETIDSVLNQGYPNLEYIVMDGGSTDNTISILKTYSDRIIWCSEKDHGQANAINKGLKSVTGEIVAFINSDDLYEPGAFLKVAQFFRENPKSVWLSGRCRIINEVNCEVRKSITWYKNFWLKSHSYKMLLVMDYISQPATFWRKSILNEVGLFDETLTYVMDYDYWLRIGRKYPLHTIPAVLADFRTHSTSKTRSLNQFQTSEEADVIKRYTKSKFWLSLHYWHWKLIFSVYKYL